MATQPTAEPTSEQDREEGKLLTIIEHLQELRYRLIVACGALVLATVASLWPLSRWFLEFLAEPGEDRVENFQLAFFDPLEYWTTYFRVSLLLGVTLAMPVIVYQILAFVGPGLTRREKRWVYPLVVGASLAFASGCAFAYYIELPPALGFLIGAAGDVAEPIISIRRYIDFVTRLILVTGLVFEMPLVVMGLAKLGVVNSRKLLSWWRYAIVLAFVLAAVVTPSIDPVTQSLVAGPIIVLYFVGIVLAKLVEERPILPVATKEYSANQ
jgi:sec-independent protein translocase protein TatC